MFCPLSCSWRGSGWRVWGVQNPKGGLRVPQGQVRVRGRPAVQQPAVLGHTSRTSDPCGVPHHGLGARQGAHSFSSKRVVSNKEKCCDLTCVNNWFLSQHGVDSDTPLPYSHVDIAGSSGPFPGVPTGAPILAMAINYIMSNGIWRKCPGVKTYSSTCSIWNPLTAIKYSSLFFP